MLRKFGIIAVLSLMALALAAVPAFAGSPHFIKNATSASLSGANLVVNFKEAGLESGSVETITTGATATTTYECVNNGGRNPSASNKTTTVTDVSTSGTFTADKNGNLVGTQTLSPPTAASLGFSCPPGQTTTFVSVTYTNVVLTDTTSGATISLGGPFTFTNPSAP
jgi:type II secretory pathway pseudopilin PulG